MPKKTYRLTEYGQRLYWIHRGLTRDELTPEEFADEVICNAPAFIGECQICHLRVKVCGGFFCVHCSAGAITNGVRK